MRPRDFAELLSLAAIWGASFLFMRVAAPEFGAVALAGVRVLGASLVLLPLVALRGELAHVRRHWKPLLLLGCINSALPFIGFSYAALHINAGLSAIFNASTPLFTAVIAFLWLGSLLSRPKTLGILIGFVGVFGLAWSKASVKADADGAAIALSIAACIAASLCYGLAANFSKKYLADLPPMAVAAGSQAGAALVLLLPTLWLWPAQAPGALAWTHAVVLALVCTGAAYVLYFRLIAHVGPSNTVTVTFLIPAFAVVWGLLFLGEAVSPQMLLGCAVILLGTGLATGLLAPRTPAPR
jgi:drug/metabolite transporter (DMT)-like permease